MKDIYDLIVIGSGPAGEKAAVKAAYYGFSVALVERRPYYGGAGTHTGTLPSKTLKETALYLSGKRDHGMFGVDRKLEHKASIQDFFYRKDRVVAKQDNEIHDNLLLHQVDLIQGVAHFKDKNTLYINGEDSVELKGKNIVIATGSYPFHPPGISFDGKYIHDSDTILEVNRIPESIVVVGAGVIGCEYATIFAAMGCKVTLVNSHKEILPWLDREITHELMHSMHDDGIRLLTDVKIHTVSLVQEGGRTCTRADFEGGLNIIADMVLYAAGRCGRTADLNLQAVGLTTTKREALEVNEQYRTAVDNIWAVGDVIGFPALASTSMDQGRAAVAHIFGLHDFEEIAKNFPFGIYTIPEVSSFGVTEEQAKEQGIDYLIGRSLHRRMARGRILGAKKGFLKLVVERETDRVIGVHIFGTMATELIHYGMAVVEQGNDLGHLISMIYNVPTLHELYKYAAYHALTQKGDTSRIGHG